MSSAVPVSPGRRWQWPLAPIAAVAVLALVLAGVHPGCGGSSAAAAGPPLVRAPAPDPQPPAKDEAKKEEPKKEAAAKEKAGKQPGTGEGDLPDFEEMVKRMVPPGVPPEHVRQMEAQLRQTMLMTRMMMARNGQAMVPPFGLPQASRLGARLEKPGETLIEQLDLPRGQGLVVRDVETDSAAAKAGIKAHDVLLELNGKPVPDDPRELARQLDDVKADTPVDAVVLRKGKRETVKGLTLPEAPAAAAPFPNFNIPAFPQGPAVAPPLPVMPGLPNLGFGGNGVLTTTLRTADRFTTRHQEGSLVITVTGTVADGKIKVGAINVQDGSSTQKFDSADKVPEQYRDKVKDLLEICEKSAHVTVQP
jgi:hypothetical protein